MLNLLIKSIGASWQKIIVPSKVRDAERKPALQRSASFWYQPARRSASTLVKEEIPEHRDGTQSERRPSLTVEPWVEAE
jgi:hypothetical protein